VWDFWGMLRKTTIRCGVPLAAAALGLASLGACSSVDWRETHRIAAPDGSDRVLVIRRGDVPWGAVEEGYVSAYTLIASGRGSRIHASLFPTDAPYPQTAIGDVLVGWSDDYSQAGVLMCDGVFASSYQLGGFDWSVKRHLSPGEAQHLVLLSHPVDEARRELGKAGEPLSDLCLHAREMRYREVKRQTEEARRNERLRDGDTPAPRWRRPQ
jgi:hypothetical protein